MILEHLVAETIEIMDCINIRNNHEEKKECDKKSIYVDPVLFRYNENNELINIYEIMQQ
jgi:hypothetical protein